MERGSFLTGFGYNFIDFSGKFRTRKLLAEYTSLLRKYLECKKLLQNEHDMDAYRYCLEALHHWSRIAVIEEGLTPEVSVLRQVKGINPGIYKLYEELTMSKESVRQRVKLVLLACEFAVMSKMEACCMPLIDLIRSRPEPLCVEDLMDEEELRDVRGDLPLLLDKLAGRSFIRKVFVPGDLDFEAPLALMYTT
jgi:hypothetical protein